MYINKSFNNSMVIISWNAMHLYLHMGMPLWMERSDMSRCCCCCCCSHRRHRICLASVIYVVPYPVECFHLFWTLCLFPLRQTHNDRLPVTIEHSTLWCCKVFGLHWVKKGQNRTRKIKTILSLVFGFGAVYFFLSSRFSLCFPFPSHVE